MLIAGIQHLINFKALDLLNQSIQFLAIDLVNQQPTTYQVLEPRGYATRGDLQWILENIMQIVK